MQTVFGSPFKHDRNLPGPGYLFFFFRLHRLAKRQVQQSVCEANSELLRNRGLLDLDEAMVPIPWSSFRSLAFEATKADEALQVGRKPCEVPCWEGRSPICIYIYIYIWFAGGLADPVWLELCLSVPTPFHEAWQLQTNPYRYTGFKQRLQQY